MDKIDIVIFIILGVALLRGFFKGLKYELTSLLGVIAALFAALKLSKFAISPLTTIGLSERVAHFSAGVIIFLLVVFIVNMVSKLIFAPTKIGALGLFDNLIGAFISCVKYSIMLCAVLLIIVNINNSYHIFAESHVENSIMYNGYLQVAEKVYEIIK